MLTVREVAERTGAAVSSIRVWLSDNAERAKRFPGARKESTPMGEYWVIPEGDIAGYTSKGRGRPQKPLEELKGRPRRKVTTSPAQTAPKKASK